LYDSPAFAQRRVPRIQISSQLRFMPRASGGSPGSAPDPTVLQRLEAAAGNYPPPGQAKQD